MLMFFFQFYMIVTFVRVVNHLDPWRHSKTFSGRGMAYSYLVVLLFNCPQFPHNLNFSDFFYLKQLQRQKNTFPNNPTDQKLFYVISDLIHHWWRDLLVFLLKLSVFYLFHSLLCHRTIANNHIWPWKHFYLFLKKRF